jgi:hypothetical protein
MGLEKECYERAEFWGANIYQQEFEFARLSMCVGAIPPLFSSLLDVGWGSGVFLSMVKK